VTRLIGKDAISARQLGQEIGVPQTTLSRWLEDARSLPRVPPPKKQNAWTVDEKVKILAGAATLTGEQLSAFLEQHGVRLAEFDQWRLALDEEGRSSKAVTNRIRGLERELAHKVAVGLTKHDALGAHARDELGISEMNVARPIQAAFASAASFATGACECFCLLKHTLTDRPSVVLALAA